MGKPPEGRKYRRFDLSFPVRVNLKSGGLRSEVKAITRNLSLGGLLLETTSMIPQNSELSFVMTIEGNPVVRPIELVGKGNVVRVEKTSHLVRLAVECKSRIRQRRSKRVPAPPAASARVHPNAGSRSGNSTPPPSSTGTLVTRQRHTRLVSAR